MLTSKAFVLSFLMPWRTSRWSSNRVSLGESVNGSKHLYSPLTDELVARLVVGVDLDQIGNESQHFVLAFLRERWIEPNVEQQEFGEHLEKP